MGKGETRRAGEKMIPTVSRGIPPARGRHGGVHNNLNARLRELKFRLRNRRPLSRGKKGGRKKNAIVTCPCCFAIRLLLDCFPSIDSYCCNHSSVSLQQKNIGRHN